MNNPFKQPLVRGFVEICQVQGCNKEVAHISEDEKNHLFHRVCDSHNMELKKGKKLKYNTSTVS